MIDNQDDRHISTAVGYAAERHSQLRALVKVQVGTFRALPPEQALRWIDYIICDRAAFFHSLYTQSAQTDRQLRLMFGFSYWVAEVGHKKIVEHQHLPLDQQVRVALDAYEFFFCVSGVLLAQHNALRGGDADAREAGLLSVSGWARSKLSLSVNQRLDRAIKTEAELGNADAETIFRALLPAAVLVALDALDSASWSEKTLLKEIRKEISGIDPIQGKRDERTQQPRVRTLMEADSESIEQAFVLCEETRREESRAIMREARLTAREVAVMELDVQEYKEREIAAQLGITIGAVKKLKDRAKRRLKVHLRPTG